MEIRASYKWDSKSSGDLGRRAFLGALGLAAVRAQQAEVAEFDLSLFEEWTVPAELFFVREHFPAPNVSSAGWKVSVGGMAAAPFAISYDELTGLETRNLAATLECAENPSGGGLVSHAEWTGVALGALLERARPGTDASHVRLASADGFSRTIPLAKASHQDTLLVYRMNGNKLPVNHGFPVRVLVPGWYGMDSVKWLRSVELVAGPDPNNPYVRSTRSLLAGKLRGEPLSRMNVNSALARPVDGAILSRRRFVVRGVAWAGEDRVRSVEVSTDAGKSWAAARLSRDPAPYAWTPWTYDWRIPAAGKFELAVRATDGSGRTQPPEREPGRADAYEMNAWQRVRVTVL